MTAAWATAASADLFIKSSAKSFGEAVAGLVSFLFVFAGRRLRFIPFRRSPASFHFFLYLPVAGLVSFLFVFAGRRLRFIPLHSAKSFAKPFAKYFAKPVAKSLLTQYSE